MQKITPHLWFDDQAEEAANFYVSLFEDSKIKAVSHYPKSAEEVSGRPAGSVMTVSFQLAGQDFLALNGGPIFKFNESVSFMVGCKDQAEIDELWNKLSAVPESEQCGWLKDKYGLSWQIIPDNMSDLIKSENAMQAMLKMKKIDIAELKKASEKE